MFSSRHLGTDSNKDEANSVTVDDTEFGSMTAPPNGFTDQINSLMFPPIVKQKEVYCGASGRATDLGLFTMLTSYIMPATLQEMEHNS